MPEGMETVLQRRRRKDTEPRGLGEPTGQRVAKLEEPGPVSQGPPSGPSSPRQREPSRLLTNPRGQVHMKLPTVLLQSPPEQRPSTLTHSSTSVETMPRHRAAATSPTPSPRRGA